VKVAGKERVRETEV